MPDCTLCYGRLSSVVFLPACRPAGPPFACDQPCLFLTCIQSLFSHITCLFSVPDYELLDLSTCCWLPVWTYLSRLCHGELTCFHHRQWVCLPCSVTSIRIWSVYCLVLGSLPWFLTYLKSTWNNSKMPQQVLDWSLFRKWGYSRKVTSFDKCERKLKIANIPAGHVCDICNIRCSHLSVSHKENIKPCVSLG